MKFLTRFYSFFVNEDIAPSNWRDILSDLPIILLNDEVFIPDVKSNIKINFAFKYPSSFSRAKKIADLVNGFGVSVFFPFYQG